MDKIFDFDQTWQLLGFSFVQTALLAAAVLGLVAGVLGPLIVMRRMSFAGHGTSELAFTGGAAALLLGIGVGYGALIGAGVAGLLLGILGARDAGCDSVIGGVPSVRFGIGGVFL